MKVIAFDRSARKPLSSSCNVDIMPDSAIIKDNKPFFIPTLSDDWKYFIAPAFRIARLGKNIASRFAHRYIDGVTTAIITRPEGTSLSGLINIFEGAIIIGEWCSPEVLTSASTITSGDFSLHVGNAFDEACELLARTSAVGTIKIGDILVPSRDLLDENIPLDSSLTAKLDDKTILSFRIK